MRRSSTPSRKGTNMAEYEGDCVFCGIVAGTEPAPIIREWPDAMAFVPLGPVVPGGHVLVVPRQHVANAVQDPAVTAATMLRAVELASEYEFSNILTSPRRGALPRKASSTCTST